MVHFQLIYDKFRNKLPEPKKENHYKITNKHIFL